MRKSLSNSKLLSVGESCRKTDSEQWVSNNKAFSRRKGHSTFIWKMIASVSITSLLTTIITASIQIQKPIIRAFCESWSLKLSQVNQVSQKSRPVSRFLITIAVRNYDIFWNAFPVKGWWRQKVADQLSKTVVQSFSFVCVCFWLILHQLSLTESISIIV